MLSTMDGRQTREILARIDCREEEKMRQNCNNSPAIGIINPLAKEKKSTDCHDYISLSKMHVRSKGERKKEGMMIVKTEDSRERRISRSSG